MRLLNKVAIITGAASGIGRKTAFLFAVEGARIIASDIEDTGGEETAAHIRKNNGDSIFVHTDISVVSDVKHLIGIAKEKYGKVDILFNSAGIFMKNTPIEEIEESLWDRVFTINVKGTFLAIKYTVPLMKNCGGGVIINMASIAGKRPAPYSSPYASSKGAIITFTKALAKELGQYNIRVNCICPSPTETPMADIYSEEALKGCVAKTPLGRLMQPEDIANLALYLASAESLMITGEAIDVDGGFGI